jgi:hypothetical protein
MKLASSVDEQSLKVQTKLYNIFLESSLEPAALPNTCAAHRLVGFMTDLYTSFPQKSVR